MKKIYRFLSSIKLTITLTYIIVCVTMAGSFVLLFNRSAFEAIDSSVLIEWMKGHRFSDFWWIILIVALIFLFALNTLFCTYDRVSSLAKAWRGRRVAGHEEEETFVSQDILRGKGIRIRTLLPYIAHIGFLIALAGHFAGSLWGFRGGDFRASEGETVQIREAEGFSLKIGGLEMKTGERGYPEEMSAVATLLSDGKEVKTRLIEVNRPLLYGNMAVYIKNVMQTPEGLKIRQSGRGGGSTFLLTAGKSVPLEGGNIRITAGRIDEQYRAMELLVFDGGRLSTKKWLTPYNPNYRSFDFQGYTISAEEMKFSNAGIFNVNRDPGVWIVMTGLGIFVVSLAFHLFLRK